MDEQIARNVTMDGCGILCTRRYLLHGRDTKYSAAFRTIIPSAHIETVRLPARSPNLNAHAERWVRSAKDECLSKIIFFGERSLRRAMKEYVEHYHTVTEVRCENPLRCRERLGGLLRYYHQNAA
jgi:putative transposase